MQTGPSSRMPQFALYYAISWVVAFVMIFLLTEILFALLVPNESLFKVGSLGSDDASTLNSTFCKWERRKSNALAFFADKNSSLVPQDVKYVIGGVPATLGTTLAMVVDDAVYFARRTSSGKRYCPSTSTIVHELVHVKDFQTNFFFSMGAGGFWSWLINQAKDPASLYSFGNLTDQRAAGKLASEFGIEQRASIVESYFTRETAGKEVNGTALEAYALEILQ